MIGIDKSKINNITLHYLDRDKFLSNDNVTLSASSKDPYGVLIPIDNKNTDNSLLNIQYLGIKDEALFDKLQVGIKKNKGHITQYAMIELTIADKTNNNLIPYSVTDYYSRLERIRSYLESRYGLYISYENVTFSELELNITQKMDHAMPSYYHILTLMLDKAPSRYKTRALYKDTNGSLTGMTASNKSTQVKVYDKTHQLDTIFNIKVEGEYMRIEYTLKNAQRIERALGTTKLSEIKNKKIAEFLHTEIMKDLITPVEDHIKYSDKELKKLYKATKQSIKRGYVKDFTLKALAQPLTDQGDTFLLFDIEQIKTIVGDNDKKSRSRNNKLIDSLTAEHHRFQNNFDKFQEIKDKFTK